MTAFIAAIFLALGGLGKGAIGAGAPILAVPALTMLYDVKTAGVATIRKAHTLKGNIALRSRIEAIRLASAR